MWAADQGEVGLCVASLYRGQLKKSLLLESISKSSDMVERSKGVAWSDKG